MKKLTAILLTFVMLFTCLSDTAIAVEYSSEAAGNGYVEVIYDIPIYSMYGYLNSNYAIAITLPNNFGGPQDVTESIRWEAYYAGSKFTLKPGDPYKALEEPEFNSNAKGGYVDEQLILFGALTHSYSEGFWTTLPILDEYNAATSIRIKATFNIRGGIGNSHINNIDNYSYLQLVDAETYEPVIATTVYGTSWSAAVREHHEGNFSPVTGTTHSGYCNLCGKTITEDCAFVNGYCEWCLQEERFTPVYWEPKDSELSNMSAANEAVLNVKLNKPIVGMAEYTLYAKASADVSDNWFSMSAERVFVDTVSVDGTASELNFRVPTEYIYSGCGFAAFENISLYDSDIMADYMHVDRAKVGNEAGSKGRLSWKAAGDDKLYFDGLPTNYTKLGVQHNYSLNMGADVEAIQYSLTADTSGTYYTLNPANGTVGFGTATVPGNLKVGFDHLEIVFNKNVQLGGKNHNQHYAKLDFSKGTISLYKRADFSATDELIWKATVNTFDDGTTSSSVYATNNVLRIAPTNHHTLLEYESEYYVIIDPGVIQFEDGTTFEGITNGEWRFRTIKEETINGEFEYRSSYVNGENNAKYKFTFDNSYFMHSSFEYDHQLAIMSLKMAMAAFGCNKYDTASNIKSLLSDMHFQYNSSSINYPKPGMDTIGYAIGSKRIVDNNMPYTLIAVAIRGGGYEGEWSSNATVGSSGNHNGFQQAADAVYSGLINYINALPNSKMQNYKVWITGYSRAAAVANLMSYKLNLAVVNKKVPNLVQDDIFTYCFETPQGAISDINNPVTINTNNIYSIINDNDLVPYVAPLTEWQFGRYGTSLRLPSSVNTNKYKQKKDNMLKAYKNILNYSNISKGVEYGEVEAQPYQVSNIIDCIVELISREKYYNSLQSELRKLLSKGLLEADYGGALKELTVAWYHHGKITTLCGSNKDNIIKIVLDFATDMTYPGYILKNSISFLYIQLGNDTNNGILITDESLVDALCKAITGSSKIIKNCNLIKSSHYPELSLAWLESIEGNINIDYSSSQYYRKLIANCPVDMNVYDSNGKLVASIINDEVQEIEDSTIGAIIDGDGQKVIILPCDEQYTMNISATDSGKMTYTVIEHDIGTGEEEKVVSYYELDLEKGDTFVGTVENLDINESAQYTLFKDGEPIVPTVVQIGDDIKEYSVNVTSEGSGTSIGGGIYVNGEFAMVTAEADKGEEFLGWYIDGVNVSSDAEYRFLVDKDITITAKFTSSENAPTPQLPQHTHFFSTWQYDPAYHWLSCIGCGLTTDFAPHTFVNGVCSICGYVDVSFAADADQSDRIEIDLPTEGLIIREEEVNIEEIIE